MSFPLIKKAPSSCEASCPDCGVTLSRMADMNRHRKTRHSDGTETKFHCPWPGCDYRAMQKGNLKAHIDARHSNGRQYPCPDCNEAFTDAAARIRHRKSAHGYQPYHTEEYLARQSLKGKESAVQEGGKVVSSKTSRQRAVSAAPYTRPQASSSSDAVPPKFLKVTYHNDFWKSIVDMARYYTANPELLQDIQVGLPLATNPGSHSPGASIQGLPNISQPVAPSQPSSHVENLIIDDLGFFGFQVDAMSLQGQGQALAGPSTQEFTTPHAMPSESSSFFSSPMTNTTAFTSTTMPPNYSGVSFLHHPQEYAYSDISSSMLGAITPEASISTSSSSPSVDPLSLLTPNSYDPAALLEPAPAGPSWSPGSSQDISMEFSQFDDFVTPGKSIDFDYWFQSSLLASER